MEPDSKRKMQHSSRYETLACEDEEVSNVENAASNKEGEPCSKEEILGNNRGVHFSGADNDVELNSKVDNSGEIDEHSSTLARLTVLGGQSLPIITSFCLGFGGTFSILIFAGHLVDKSGSRSTVLAGISLANMYCNITCQSILTGMSTAVETLGSQYNGAKKYEEVGNVLWRCIMILGIMLVPISAAWIYAGDIFLTVGIDPAVCEVLTNYIRIRMCTLPIDVFNMSYEKYLISLGVMYPSMYANIAFNLNLVALSFLFVDFMHWSYRSLALAWVISIYFSSTVRVGLSWRHPSVQRTLRPWSTAALTGWGQFIALGLPGTLMLCSEWWAYEILILFASMLGTDAVAAQTIILQCAGLAYMTPLGLGIASSSLVGNAIGAKKVALAKQLGNLALGSITLFQFAIAIVIAFLGQYFVTLFTKVEGIRVLANPVMPFLGLYEVFDAIACVSSGILRGAGRQNIGAFANVVAFYVFGLPLAYFFCFHLHLGLKGLMLGSSVGVGCQVTALLYAIFFQSEYVFRPTVGDDGHEKTGHVSSDSEGVYNLSSTHGMLVQYECDAVSDADTEIIDVDEGTAVNGGEIRLHSSDGAVASDKKLSNAEDGVSAISPVLHTVTVDLTGTEGPHRKGVMAA
jgi:MATE family multidrug resistance protein